MLNTPVIMYLFGFYHVFGFLNVRFLLRVRVLSCSACSVDFVENLCKSLRKTLWKNCGKSFLILWKSEFCTILWKIIHVFDNTCGKFCHRFYTRVIPCKIEVLHSFHKDYYYDYYLF